MFADLGHEVNRKYFEVYMRFLCIWIIIFLLLPTGFLKAQYSMGTTGFLNIPSADMQPDGTFMGGGNYLPKQMLPSSWGYNTGNYFVNMTFLPFLEVAYRCTLLRGEFKAGSKWQQDRSVSIRLRPLKEAKWWPSIVLGSNDAFTTNQLNMFGEVGKNRFFSSVYGVATKHIFLSGHDLGFTFGVNVPFSKSSYKQGVFGGISYSPAFFRPLTMMMEYDTTDAVNIGVAARLFNHLSLHAFCYDFKTVSAGIRYEIQLIKR